jgi:antitoxin (DNA-binding transcriptional repressor) of toxin-antitoxin stability system
MEVSVSDLRRRMKDVLRALERNESVTLLYRGKPKGIICPLAENKPAVKVTEHPAFGMWKDRKDLRNVDVFVRTLRKGRGYRR